MKLRLAVAAQKFARSGLLAGIVHQRWIAAKQDEKTRLVTSSNQPGFHVLLVLPELKTSVSAAPGRLPLR
jgi:hypothetical protein